MWNQCEVFAGVGLHDLYGLDVSSYPDGSPMVKSPCVINPKVMIVRPRNISTFIAAMFYADAMAERGYPVQTLILPHVPGGRQDRLTDGDQLFTLKSVARMVNDRNFKRVIVVDPHSTVTPALIDRCVNISAAKVIKEFVFPQDYSNHLSGYDGVIAPDTGAAKRAFDVASALGVPFYQAGKHRDIATGKLSGFSAPPNLPAHCRYLVVDDICDGGGTFIGLAQACGNVSLDLWVTHGIFSKGTDELLNHFCNIYTTDTVARDNSNSINVFHILGRMTKWTQ